MIKKLQEISLMNLKQRKDLNLSELLVEDCLAKVIEETDELQHEIVNFGSCYIAGNSDKSDRIKNDLANEGIDTIRAILTLFWKLDIDIREAWKRNFEKQRERGKEK